MNAEVFKVFTFEAAHLLPNVPDGHKCGRLHGHSYQVEVHLSGETDPLLGWVVDFSNIAFAWEAICHPVLDHHYLNEVDGLENPTSENLARWIWVRLSLNLQPLDSVVVRETCTSGCVYRGGSDVSA